MANNRAVDPGYVQRVNAANNRTWGQFGNFVKAGLDGYLKEQQRALGVRPAAAATRPPAAIRPVATGPSPNAAPVRDYSDAQGNIYDGSSGRLKQAAGAPPAPSGGAPAPRPPAPPAARAAARAAVTAAPVAAAAAIAGSGMAAPSYAGVMPAAIGGGDMLADARGFLSELKANGGAFDQMAPMAPASADFERAAAPMAQGLAAAPLRDASTPLTVGTQAAAGGASAGRAPMSDEELNAARNRAFSGAANTQAGRQAVTQLLADEARARGLQLDDNLNKYSIGSLEQMLAKAPQGAVRQEGFRPLTAQEQPFGDGRNVSLQADTSGLDGPQQPLTPPGEQRFANFAEKLDGYMTAPTGLKAALAANPDNQVPLDQPASWENARMVVAPQGSDSNMLAALAGSGLAPAPTGGREVAAALQNLYGGRQGPRGLTYDLGYVDPEQLPPAYSNGMTIPSGNYWR